MFKRFFTVFAALVVLAGACSGDDEAAVTSDAGGGVDDSDEESGSGDPVPDLALGASGLGDIVMDVDGNSVYSFVPDAQGESTCYDQCETNWPVVGELGSVGSSLDAGLLGTTTRTNGDVQATYNDWPLYYFAGDSAAGDTNGQGVNDVWYVIDAEGNAIGSAGSD